MLKNKSHPFQIIFDIETIPCLDTAKRTYPELQKIEDGHLAHTDEDEGLPSTSFIEQEILEQLYNIAGATEEDPKPFLKCFLHRVVSIAGISRKHVAVSEENPIGVELNLFSLPNGDLEIAESDIIYRFLKGVEQKQPQLVGWSSTFFDMPVLLQRAMINGLAFPGLQRPNKPWEGADYFSKGSDYNVDLMDLISSYYGKSKATLNEFARACRIPGKVGVIGGDVADMWFDGHKYREIINYNECDTCTTYLLWLEMLKISGHILEEDYHIEKQMFRKLLEDRISGGAEHLARFVEEWDSLQ